MNRRSLLIAATTFAGAQSNQASPIQAPAAPNSLYGAVDALTFVPEALRAAVASGQGAVDLSRYLQQAHNAAAWVRYGPGVYTIGHTLLLPSGGGVIGSGYATRIKLLENAGDVSIFANANPAPKGALGRDRGIAVLNLVVDGNRSGNSSATSQSHGVRLSAVADAVVDIWAENMRGDGVMLLYAQGDLKTACEGVWIKLRAVNCYRNGLSVVGGRNILFDVVSTNSGLCGVDLENDWGNGNPSEIRDVMGRLVDESSGRDFVGTIGYSFLADCNGGVLDNVVVDVVSRDHADNGVGYRGATNTTIRAQIVNPTLHGVVGVDGGMKPSQVTLDFSVDSPGQRGLVDRTTRGGELNITRGIIRGEHDVMYVEGKARGVLAGVQTERFGLQLHDCSNLILSAPRLSGPIGLLVDGQSTGNRLAGGTIAGRMSGLVETGGANGNTFMPTSLDGATTVDGAASVLLSGPAKAALDWSPGPIASGASVKVVAPAPAARRGDLVATAFSNDLRGCTLSGYVVAQGQAAAVLSNHTGGVVDVGRGRLTLLIHKLA